MGATYKWDAKDYAKNSTAQFDWANELIDKLTLCGEEHVLDVGCGDGKVSAALSRRLSAGSGARHRQLRADGGAGWR